jgi:hypothetical protein
LTPNPNPAMSARTRMTVNARLIVVPRQTAGKY